MEDQELLDFKNKYQNNPVQFAEDFYGIKLHAYQKQILKAMCSIDKAKNYICGRMPGKVLLQNLELEYMKTMEMNFQIWSKNGIEIYEKGILVKTLKNK